MIDWHSHILPGLDDGAKTVDESLAIGRQLFAAGFRTVHCTPHRLRGMYEIPANSVRAACAELQAVFTREGLALRLLPGMEYCLDEFFPDDFKDPLPLGQSGQILVETPSQPDLQLLKENVFLIRRAGYTPLLAHPERLAFLAPPATGSLLQGVVARLRGQLDDQDSVAGTPLAELLQMGCQLQCNLGSIGGYYGAAVQRQSERFRQLNLYVAIGSDAHNPDALQRFLQPSIDHLRKRSPHLCPSAVGDCSDVE